METVCLLKHSVLLFGTLFYTDMWSKSNRFGESMGLWEIGENDGWVSVNPLWHLGTSVMGRVCWWWLRVVTSLKDAAGYSVWLFLTNCPMYTTNPTWHYKQIYIECAPLSKVQKCALKNIGQIVLQTIWVCWLWTAILLISASGVAMITATSTLQDILYFFYSACQLPNFQANTPKIPVPEPERVEGSDFSINTNTRGTLLWKKSFSLYDLQVLDVLLLHMDKCIKGHLQSFSQYIMKSNASFLIPDISPSWLEWAEQQLRDLILQACLPLSSPMLVPFHWDVLSQAHTKWIAV
jgi:hypothetical protein